ADLPLDDIHLLNFKLWDRQIDDEGCSNLVFTRGPDGPVLGKNNDGLYRKESLKEMAVRIIRPEHGIPQINFTYAGCVACIDGLSDVGIATGSSSVGSIFQQSDHHPYIRLYEYQVRQRARTLREYVEQMTALPLHGKGFGIVAVDREGSALSIEAALPLMQVRRPDREAGISCVNCFQLPQLANADRRKPHDKEDALRRRDLFNEILDAEGPFDATHMLRILQRHDDQAVCRHGKEVGEHETLFSYICLPQKNEIRFCQGHPCEHGMQTVTL
ncbi:MAG: C45 family peptidase, partial [Planctomycetota bacterium]